MDLLIVTGLIRGNNINLIHSSIKNSLSDSGLSWKWLIVDNRNSDDDLRIIDDNVVIYKNNSIIKIYGGSLFNKPIKELRYNHDLIDDETIIYILDDDNLFNPLIVSEIFRWRNEYSYYDARVLTMMMSNGTTSSPYISDKYHSIALQSDIVDPSQLLIKFRLLNEIGMYSFGYRYDLDLTRRLMKVLSKVVFDQDIYNHDEIHPECYHNALKYLEKSNSNIDSSEFIIHSDDGNSVCTNVMSIDKKLANKIIKLIKSYNNE